MGERFAVFIMFSCSNRKKDLAKKQNDFFVLFCAHRRCRFDVNTFNKGERLKIILQKNKHHALYVSKLLRTPAGGFGIIPDNAVQLHTADAV